MSFNLRNTIAGVCLGLIVCAAVVVVVDALNGNYSPIAFALVVTAITLIGGRRL